jgi:uncharacterized protein
VRPATILPDPDKEERNLRAHKMDFSGVAEIFYRDVVDYLDTREVYDDGRQRVLGVLRGQIVVLVYEDVQIETGEYAVRPISLRKAEPKEKRAYRDGGAATASQSRVMS